MNPRPLKWQLRALPTMLHSLSPRHVVTTCRQGRLTDNDIRIFCCCFCQNKTKQQNAKTKNKFLFFFLLALGATICRSLHSVVLAPRHVVSTCRQGRLFYFFKTNNKISLFTFIKSWTLSSFYLSLSAFCGSLFSKKKKKNNIQ